MRDLCVYYATTVKYGFKMELMEAFAKPLQDEGIHVIHHRGAGGFEVKNTSHALIFNYQRVAPNQDKLKDRLQLRVDVWNKYKDSGKIWMFDNDVLNGVDSHLNHNYEYDIKNSYVRVAYSDIYPGKAKYFNENCPSDRWDTMAKIKHIELKNYDLKGDYIYICCNRGSSGYSGLGVNAAQWSIETVEELRKYTDRPIIIRQHSSRSYVEHKTDYRRLKEFCETAKNVSLHSPLGDFPNLVKAIRKSYAVVIFTSTAGGPAIIEGKPLFICNKRCYFLPMRAGRLSDIENPNISINRQQFLNNLGYSHWRLSDLKDGIYWRRVKDVI